MSRYIEADAVEKAICKRVYAVEVEDILAEMANAPSIDIVRCKECKHCKRKKGTFRGEPIFFYRCAEHSRDVESDDFCSWGEREGE